MAFAPDCVGDAVYGMARALQAGDVYYNYDMTKFPSTEAPGLSVFHRDDGGEIFHTYSAYARGLDVFNSAYQLLDMVPKGRDEDEGGPDTAGLHVSSPG